MSKQRKKRNQTRNLVLRDLDELDEQYLMDGDWSGRLDTKEMVSWLMEGGDRVYFSDQIVRWVDSDEWELELIPHGMIQRNLVN